MAAEPVEAVAPASHSAAPLNARDDSMQAMQLVDLIDLKWLLAGRGHRLHVERMLADRGYAQQWLAMAAQSPGAEVREAAAKVCRQLGFDVAKTKQER